MKYLSLSDYIGLMVGMEPGGNGVHIAALIALAAAFVVCFAVNPVIGIGLIVAAVTFSILTYYKMKAKVEHYFVCIAQIVRMTAVAQAIAQQKTQGWKNITKSWRNFAKNSSRSQKMRGCWNPVMSTARCLKWQWSICVCLPMWI